jgi:hypothetical protein
MYEFGLRVRLGKLDSVAGFGLISPQIHELTPNFATQTRTSLAHWNPSQTRSCMCRFRISIPFFRADVYRNRMVVLMFLCDKYS